MDVQVDGWSVAKVLWGFLVSLLSFLGLRQLRRIDNLEKTTVKKVDFKEEMKIMREDRLSMHKDNKVLLEKIDCKIDAAERRRAVVEHELGESIHGVAVRIEQVNATAEKAVTAANAAASAATGKYPRIGDK